MNHALLGAGGFEILGGFQAAGGVSPSPLGKRLLSLLLPRRLEMKQPWESGLSTFSIFCLGQNCRFPTLVLALHGGGDGARRVERGKLWSFGALGVCTVNGTRVGKGSGRSEERGPLKMTKE